MPRDCQARTHYVALREDRRKTSRFSSSNKKTRKELTKTLAVEYSKAARLNKTIRVGQERPRKTRDQKTQNINPTSVPQDCYPKHTIISSKRFFFS